MMVMENDDGVDSEGDCVIDVVVILPRRLLQEKQKGVDSSHEYAASAGRSIMLVDYGLCCCVEESEGKGKGPESPVSRMLTEVCRIAAKREAEERNTEAGPR